jgi:D-tyrosyl-tRNA(Tyr) deacylase
MRAVVQRVSSATVSVEGDRICEAGRGLLVLLGVANEDRPEDADWLADKVADLRIFEDEAGKLNASVKEIGGEVVVVSQFTLYGDTRKGRRPSFSDAAPPERGATLYRRFVERIQSHGLAVGEGRFGAHMMVALVNDGPVTLIVESPRRPS